MTALAPAAPGHLGEQLDPQAVLSYLDALRAWVDARRAELDDLDALVQASDHAAELTADIRLGLTLWNAISKRYDLLLRTWDSGRVGPVEREKLSQLIWGRLETAGSIQSGAATGGMSLPEACRLSDALTGQLRQRLQLDPAGSVVLRRVRDLLATLERLRDQVGLEPTASSAPARSRLAQLEARMEAIQDKSARGGDVGGLLGPLELEAATFERDLIVGGAQRRANAGRVAQLTAERDRLSARIPALQQLVTRTLASVTPAPKYAVPDVANLGPVPATTADLDTYASRLDAVGRAMDMVERAYSDALAQAEQLRAEAAVVASAGADDALRGMLTAIDGLLAQRPLPVEATKQLIAAAQAYAAARKGL